MLYQFTGGGRFAHYQHDPSDPYSLSTNTVTAVIEDRSSALVGHEAGGGLSKLAAGSGRSGHYRHVPNDPNSLSGDQVTSLAEDQEGALWIGTFSGLDRWQKTTGRWENSPYDPGDPGSLAHDDVRSVYVHQSDVLGLERRADWIATTHGRTGSFALARPWPCYHGCGSMPVRGPSHRPRWLDSSEVNWMPRARSVDND